MMEERKKRITEVFKKVFGMEPSKFYIHRDYLKDRIEEQLEAYHCFQLFNVQFELSVVELSEFEKSLLKNSNVQFELSVVELSEFEKSLLKNSFKSSFMKEDLSYRKFNMRMFVIQFFQEDYRIEIWIGIFPFVNK